MAELQNGKDDDRQWFLRINGETVFGPVSTQGLIVWAEQGRILPGHEVSSDRKKWTQAVSLDILDMRWYVDDGEGELRGPLNRLAAEALIKSGKVAEGAQLVSADEVEAEAESGATASPPPEAGGQRSEVREQRSEIRGQRSEIRGQRSETGGRKTEPCAGSAGAPSAKEREEQQRRIRELETQVAELEPLRRQVKKLERQLEEVRGGGERVAELERALQLHERRTEETAQILSVREAELEAARAELKACGQRLEQAETRLAAAEAARREAEERLCAAATARQEAEVRLDAEETARLKAEARADAAEAAGREAETRARAAEAELTELLNDANARDIKYQEKIAELEKLCSQPPEETARFFADQAAVYELINAEVAELAAALEREKTQAEQLKTWSAQRQQSLQERRQKLLKHLGGSPGEMTRRAVREQPSDPQLARLRAELENLRVTYQREVRLAETKEREWQERLNALESEGTRLRAQVVAGEKKAQRVQELEELAGRREHELVLERKNREEEREQFEANQRALLMRIETLERSAKPGTPEEIQSAEARSVKLASWMRLKR
jgi:hypothetical protein